MKLFDVGEGVKTTIVESSGPMHSSRERPRLPYVMPTMPVVVGDF